MSAVNAVLLFVLVSTCQADKDIGVSCNDVTGSAGVTLTCSVSLERNDCCITQNSFKYKNLTICAQELPENPCERRKSFTCYYNPPTAVTEKFRFFVQATCGWSITEFNVDTTGYFRRINLENPSRTSPPETAVGLGSKDAVMVVSGFTIMLILLIIFIIYKTKANSTKLSGSQNKMFLVLRHDEDNRDHPEDVI